MLLPCLPAIYGTCLAAKEKKDKMQVEKFVSTTTENQGCVIMPR
jgi:hypothetical protein